MRHFYSSLQLHNKPTYQSQYGMTLLELTVVLLILVTLATIALRSTSGLQDQARWELTKSRFDELKKSIIGDPSLSINGQPDISGFVADMGRLPVNIKELLSQNYCDNDYEETVPGGCAGTWVTNTGSFINCSDGVSADEVTCTGLGETWYSIRAGWNGPYLLTNEASTEGDAFADGWGNTAAVLTDLNYGWTFDATGSPLMDIQSTGCGGGCELAEYNNAYPATATVITQNDWQINVGGNITVQIKMPYSGTCAAATCSIPIYPDGATCSSNGGVWACDDNSSTDKTSCEAVPAIWTEPSKANCEAGGQVWAGTSHALTMQIRYRNNGGGTSLTATSTNTPAVIEDGQFHYVNFSFADPTNIPMGINLIEIKDAGADFQHAGLEFSFVPRHSLPTINW